MSVDTQVRTPGAPADAAQRLFDQDAAPVRSGAVIGPWWALVRRGLRRSARSGELISAIVSPALLAACFYYPLHRTIGAQGIDYGQFLLPIIVLQSVSFVATGAAVRSATDIREGISTRLRALPMPANLPWVSRLSVNMAVAAVSVAVAFACGLAIGWRNHGGAGGLVALLVVIVAVTVLAALAADTLGVTTANPVLTTQIVTLPSLILGMLSTGFIPESNFPEWIRPFARNQPISQFIDAMRTVSDGEFAWHRIASAAAWWVGLTVVTVIWAQRSGRR
ncbi:daunorubicin ABC transporter ATP-binding protein DrrA [Gordonia jinhuaensis]|uniref:Doxorubicin resistance ABC transporter permease DrrB n=1 Tax=Gordonia jinhuaensis TaxID=1517702 RepID=A0A916TM83_9ACTN|nr:ABC transporter permease [Gordonia jinhuaensis]GGB48403.1 doxorubicin resistance ABC transporter permease DrrB [Gordonia jinhuaensis]